MAHPVQPVRAPQRRELLGPVIALVVVGRRAPDVQPRPVELEVAEPRSTPVARSNSPGPSVIGAVARAARAGATARRGASAARRATAARRDRRPAPHATSWPAGAHGSSAASTARTVSHASPVVGGSSSGQRELGDRARRQRADAQRRRAPPRRPPPPAPRRTPGARGRGSRGGSRPAGRRRAAGDPHRLEDLLELDQPRRRRAVGEQQAVGDEVRRRAAARRSRRRRRRTRARRRAARGRSTPRRTRPGSAGGARRAPGTPPARPGPLPIACAYSHSMNGIRRRRASSAASSSGSSSPRPIASTSSCDAYMRE